MSRANASLTLWIDDAEAHLFRSKEPTLAWGARVVLWMRSTREDPPGSLPADETILAEWARLTPEEWASVRGYILPSWKLDRRRQRYLIRRVREAMRQRCDTSEQNRTNAKRRWEKSGKSTPPQGLVADALAMRSQCDRNASLSPSLSPSLSLPRDLVAEPPTGDPPATSPPVSGKPGKNGKTPDPEQVQELLQHYRARLRRRSYDASSPKRKGIIAEAFGSFDLESLKAVVDIFATNQAYAWNRGENPDHKRYDGLCEYILAKGTKVSIEERIEEIARQGGMELVSEEEAPAGS